MGIAAIMMIPIGILGGRLIYRVISSTPHFLLIPSIATVTILGTFALRNNWTDVLIMVILGVAGFVLKEIGFDPAPIVLGIILGSIAEIGFIQTTLQALTYDYPFLKLFESTLSRILLALALLSFFSPLITNRLQKRSTPTSDVENTSEGQS